MIMRKSLMIKALLNRHIHLQQDGMLPNFQKLELEGKTTDINIEPDYYQAWLRWIFVIGAHGAHQY